MKKLELNSEVINRKNPPKIQPVSMQEKLSTPERPDMKNQAPKPEIKTGKPKRNIFRSIAEKYKQLTNPKKYLMWGGITLLVLCIVGVVTYFTIFKATLHEGLNVPDYISMNRLAKPEALEIISLPLPTAPRDQENPINGELYSAKEFKAIQNKYPIAVMIENHTDARMQSGYNSADLVFETLAEGGITRTMAIFWGKEADEIGPIRSARVYYIEWLLPFDPLYMYIGYAQSDDPRTDAAGAIYNYGIKGLNIGGSFWRSEERYAPHNAYSSSQLMYESAADAGYTGTPSKIDSWKFKKDAAIDSRGTQAPVNIVFYGDLNNGGLFDVTWTYDKNRNVYLRSNYETPYTDENTGAQVYAKNVIIQRVAMENAYDEGARIIITTIGEGDAIILLDGKAVTATWKKADAYSRTKYYDSTGKEIVFNRGITWVEAVPINQGSVDVQGANE